MGRLKIAWKICVQGKSPKKFNRKRCRAQPDPDPVILGSGRANPHSPAVRAAYQSRVEVLGIASLPVAVRDEPHLRIGVEGDERVGFVYFEEVSNRHRLRFGEGRRAVVSLVAGISGRTTSWKEFFFILTRAKILTGPEPAKISVEVDAGAADGMEMLPLTGGRTSVLPPHSILKKGTVQ